MFQGQLVSYNKAAKLHKLDVKPVTFLLVSSV